MRLRYLLPFAAGLVLLGSPASAETKLTIMSFNIWGGGANEQKPVDETVAAIKYVSLAIPHAEDSVATLIRTLRPLYFVKGKDWSGGLPFDVFRACEDTGTEVVFVDTERRHTSEARG